MHRRTFLESLAATVALPIVTPRLGPALAAQNPPASEWGSPVFDLHFHMRQQPAATLAHLDGAGVTKANLLTRAGSLEQVKATMGAAPGRFTWFNSYDVSKPDAEQVLTQAVKDGARASAS